MTPNERHLQHIKYQIHEQMRIRFGDKTCPESHRWLVKSCGFNHIADLNLSQSLKVLAKIKNIQSLPVVRRETWDMLANKTTPKNIFTKPIIPKKTKKAKTNPNLPITPEECQKFVKKLLIEFAKEGYLEVPNLTIKLENLGGFRLWISLTPTSQNIVKIMQADYIIGVESVKSIFNATINIINFALRYPVEKFISECKCIKHINIEDNKLIEIYKSLRASATIS